MKKYFLLGLTLVSISSFALNQTPDISGQYICKGRDPFAKVNYEAPLTVTKTGETFQFSWDFRKDGKYIGTGFYPQNSNELLAVVVTSLSKTPNPNNPHDAELQIYQVGQDGSLSGRWTFLGKNELSSVEICKKK